SDAERAYASFVRLILYVGTLVLAVAAARVCRRSTLVAALALAVVAIVGAALVAQLFPGAVGVAGGGSGIAATQRLSFPLGYWNGLAIFAALGYPLLIGLASTSRRTLASGLALAPAPLLAAVIYLASSRGGVATAVLGSAALVVAARRWGTLSAAVVAAVGSAAGLAVVHAHGAATRGTGHALALVLCAAATGVAGA